MGGIALRARQPRRFRSAGRCAPPDRRGALRGSGGAGGRDDDGPADPADALRYAGRSAGGFRCGAGWRSGRLRARAGSRDRYCGGALCRAGRDGAAAGARLRAGPGHGDAGRGAGRPGVHDRLDGARAGGLRAGRLFGRGDFAARRCGKCLGTTRGAGSAARGHVRGGGRAGRDPADRRERGGGGHSRRVAFRHARGGRDRWRGGEERRGSAGERRDAGNGAGGGGDELARADGRVRRPAAGGAGADAARCAKGLGGNTARCRGGAPGVVRNLAARSGRARGGRLAHGRAHRAGRERRRSGAGGAVSALCPISADRVLAPRHAAGEFAGHLEPQRRSALGQQVYDQHQCRDELLAGGAGKPCAMRRAAAAHGGGAVRHRRAHRADDVPRARLGGASQHRSVAGERSGGRSRMGPVADRRGVADQHAVGRVGLHEGRGHAAPSLSAAARGEPVLPRHAGGRP